MPQLKYKIVSLLLNDETPLQISKALDVSYNKVLRYQRELNKAQDNNTVQEFIDLDSAMMQELMDGVAAKAPAAIAGEVSESMGNLAKAKGIMDVLADDMATTAKMLTTRIKAAAANAEHVGDLDTLADALCKLQNAFFNKNQTQVNVQNNYGQEPQYGAFLNDKPADH